jgi:hypothetical protein
MKPNLALFALITAALSACTDDPTGEGPARGGNDSGGTRPGADADDNANDDTGEDAAVEGDTAQSDASVEDDSGDDTACTPGQGQCIDDFTVGVCDEDGAGYTPVACAEGQLCIGTTATCEDAICVPFRSQCVGASSFRDCAPDGQSYGPEQACAEGEFCEGGNCRPVSCRPNVMFAIDGSSSMASEFGAIRASIAGVAATNPDVAMGLSMFPTALGCSIGDGTPGLFSPAVDWPHVAIDVDGASQIDAWFDANDAAGGATPLISTIEWMSEHVEVIWGAVPENGYLIVMTEGADTCRCDQPDGSISEADYRDCLVEGLGEATQALLAAGIRTYVIGYQYGDAPEALNAIAENGGTALTEFIYAGNEETLIDAFEAVLTDAKLCN